jgi:hypothetical protein
MHYSKNGIWNFGDVDTESIKPKAPNGASGGVEYEAMRYLVSPTANHTASLAKAWRGDPAVS